MSEQHVDETDTGDIEKVAPVAEVTHHDSGQASGDLVERPADSADLAHPEGRAEPDHSDNGGLDDAHQDVEDEGDEDEGDEDDEDEGDEDEDEEGDDSDVEDSDVSEPGTRTRPGKGGGGRAAQLEREGEVAADFLERLLDIADLDGDIDVDVDGDRAAVAIVDSEEGRVPRRLVGPDGKVLEALQELTRMAVQAATGERSRLMLDVAGHRAERRRIVVGLAREAIAEVRGSGTSHALPPMTAFERKVVHDEVLAAGLVSESDGVEPRRYVVIQPA